MNAISRRTFVLAATASSCLLVRRGVTAPSERITVGVIGLGSRGFNLLDELLQAPDVRIVAICDVDELHYRDRPWGKGTPFGREPARKRIESAYARQGAGRRAMVAVYQDPKELCDRNDLDAVVVATPDHWHALISLWALRSGKDVYCEKPVTHFFREGQHVIREVQARKAVFQVGSQQRSDWRFRRAVELVRNGHLGAIRRIRVGLPPGYDRPQGDTTVRKPPGHLDYERWCGPAPKLPYMRARHHRWWRGHSAYGGGVLMDWIGHHNDIAHWSLGVDESGPLEIEAREWSFPQTSVYDTPHEYTIRCRYERDIESVISDSNPMGVRWEGEDGWLYVKRGHWEASRLEWLQADFDVGAWRLPETKSHMRDFLDCIKSRQTCVAPPHVAHRSITPGHLGYVSWKLRRPLRWNAKSEVVVGDKEATEKLYEVRYRMPWKLEE